MTKRTSEELNLDIHLRLPANYSQKKLRARVKKMLAEIEGEEGVIVKVQKVSVVEATTITGNKIGDS